MYRYECPNCGYTLIVALRIVPGTALSKCPKCYTKKQLTLKHERVFAPSSKLGVAAGDKNGTVFGSGFLKGGD